MREFRDLGREAEEGYDEGSGNPIGDKNWLLIVVLVLLVVAPFAACSYILSLRDPAEPISNSDGREDPNLAD